MIDGHVAGLFWTLVVPLVRGDVVTVLRGLSDLQILDTDVTVMKRKAVLCQRILLTASLMRESK